MADRSLSWWGHPINSSLRLTENLFKCPLLFQSFYPAEERSEEPIIFGPPLLVLPVQRHLLNWTCSAKHYFWFFTFRILKSPFLNLLQQYCWSHYQLVLLVGFVALYVPRLYPFLPLFQRCWKNSEAKPDAITSL